MAQYGITNINVNSTNYQVGIRSFYGTCSTAADTATKVISGTMPSTLQYGDLIAIMFSEGTSVTSTIRLQINGTNYSVYVENVNDYYYLQPHTVGLFRYTGGPFHPVVSGHNYSTYTAGGSGTYGVGSVNGGSYYQIPYEVSPSGVAAWGNSSFTLTVKDTSGYYGTFMGCCGYSNSSRYIGMYNLYLNDAYIDDNTNQPIYKYTAYVYNCSSSSRNSTFTFYFQWKKEGIDGRLGYPGG